MPEPKKLILIGLVEPLFTEEAAVAIISPSLALPARSVSIALQVNLSTTPVALSFQLETSLDDLNWSLAAPVFDETFFTNDTMLFTITGVIANFIRLNITANATAVDVTALLLAKVSEGNGISADITTALLIGKTAEFTNGILTGFS